DGFGPTAVVVVEGVESDPVRRPVGEVHVDGVLAGTSCVPGAGSMVARVFRLLQRAGIARRSGPGVVALAAETDLGIARRPDVGVLADVVAIRAVGADPAALRGRVSLHEAGPDTPGQRDAVAPVGRNCPGSTGRVRVVDESQVEVLGHTLGRRL